MNQRTTVKVSGTVEPAPATRQQVREATGSGLLMLVQWGIMWLFWHFILVPFAIVTGLIFAIPTIILDNMRADGHAAISTVWIVLGLSFIAWIYLAMYQIAYKRIARPINDAIKPH